MDAAAFKLQYARIKPIAKSKAAAGGSNLSAWADAVSHVQARAATRAAYPVDSLVKVLADYAVFAASSSGVEQAFTKGQWAFSDRQGSASLKVEQTALKLALDYAAEEENAVCKGAQQVFARVFGKARTGARATRVDHGCAKPQRAAGTEVGFLRERRAALPKRPRAQPDGDLGETWGPGHDKELDFARNKQHARKRQACNERLLLDKEVTQGLQEEAHAESARRVDAEHERERARKRNKLKQRGTQFDIAWLRRKRAYVVPDLLTEEVRNAASDQRLRMVPLHGAQVIVQASPGVPSRLHKCVAILLGSYVVTPATLTSPTPGSDCVKFKAVMAKALKLYVSDDFKRVHEKVWQLLDRVHRGLGRRSKWTFIAKEAFLQQRAARARVRMLCALVTTAELDSQDVGCSRFCQIVWMRRKTKVITAQSTLHHN